MTIIVKPFVQDEESEQNFKVLYDDYNGKVDTDNLGGRTATAVSASSNGEFIIGVTDTSTTRTITIRTVDILNGRPIIVKDETGGAAAQNITIATENSETIDGSATQTISTNYGVVRMYSNKTNLFIW